MKGKKKSFFIFQILLVFFSFCFFLSFFSLHADPLTQAEIDELRELLQYMEYTVDANGNPVLLVTGANVQVVNGDPQSDTESTNERGNVILGYNISQFGEEVRTGSHNLVIGNYHEYTSYGGFVMGEDNKITAPYASIAGGWHNWASGNYSFIGSGAENTASHTYSFVAGGVGNTASGMSSAVAGGGTNFASNQHSSVTGGLFGSASQVEAAVKGGYNNGANGISATASGAHFTYVGGMEAWGAGSLSQPN